MKIICLILLSSVCLAACASPHKRQVTDRPIAEKLLITPSNDGHREFINAIRGAKHSVHLKMYHLTDPEVISSLVDAAARISDVKVILDGKSLGEKKFKDILEQLKVRHVNARASSPAFTVTHEKSMIVDGERAFITAINLTKNAQATRDFGITTLDTAIIAEMESVYKADWENAEKGTSNSPALTEPPLVWSPINSREKLVNLINSAVTNIAAQVENLGDPEIEVAFAQAAIRGIQVRILVPMCDKNANPLYDYPFIRSLSGKGVSVRVMPFPESAEHPYMHSKMILVDQNRAYIGSVNFSTNSTQHARELGIIFTDEKISPVISKEFESDWAVSVTPPDPPPAFCPAG
ncbi:MAG: phospholipase D-like domain-containing protein [Bdellovibrionota bacterium]